jgi:hypothetical protein
LQKVGADISQFSTKGMIIGMPPPSNKLYYFPNVPDMGQYTVAEYAKNMAERIATRVNNQGAPDDKYSRTAPTNEPVRSLAMIPLQKSLPGTARIKTPTPLIFPDPLSKETISSPFFAGRPFL